MTSDGRPRWLVGIGASAGGFMPLRTLIAELRPGLPAAVFVVMHLRAAGRSTLADQLRRVSSLPVQTAADGDRIHPGVIYVAQPDRHLTVEDGLVRVLQGPAENGYRPAIDVLYRSLAAAGDGHTIVATLSGALDDGTAGSLAVADAAGHVAVQDPDEAAVPSMPRNVCDALPGVVSLTADHLADWITTTVTEELAIVDEHFPPGASRLGSSVTSGERFACPDCGGVLEPVSESRYLAFQCRVGHRWGAEGLSSSQDTALEDALWTALRVVEEQITLDRALLDRATGAERRGAVERIGARLDDRNQAATTLRELIESLDRDVARFDGPDAADGASQVWQPGNEEAL